MLFAEALDATVLYGLGFVEYYTIQFGLPIYIGRLQWDYT